MAKNGELPRDRSSVPERHVSRPCQPEGAITELRRSDHHCMGSAVVRLRSNDLLNGTVANQIGRALHLDDGSPPGSIKNEIDPRSAKVADSRDPVAFLGEKKLEEMCELRSSHRIDSGHSGTPISR